MSGTAFRPFAVARYLTGLLAFSVGFYLLLNGWAVGIIDQVSERLPNPAPTAEDSRALAMRLRGDRSRWSLAIVDRLVGLGDSDGEAPLPRPEVVVFFGSVEFDAPDARAITGSAYDERTHKLYIDAAHIDRITLRAGEVGDLAAGYALAHLVGQHMASTAPAGHPLRRPDRPSGWSDELWAQRSRLHADAIAGLLLARALGVDAPRRPEADFGAAITAATQITNDFKLHLPLDWAMRSPFPMSGATDALETFYHHHVQADADQIAGVALTAPLDGPEEGASTEPKD